MYKLDLNPSGFVSFFSFNHCESSLHAQMLYSLTMHEYPLNFFTKILGKFKFVIEFCQTNKF